MTQDLLVRKNCARISDIEKRNFIRAILKLKADGIYDDFALIHQKLISMLSMPQVQQRTAGIATTYPYQSPAFLPWNRELCKRFEYALQLKDLSVTLPYWDWAKDATLKNIELSPVFTDDFMGGNGSATDNFNVKSGPFAYDSSDLKSWHIVDINKKFAGQLKRAFGVALAQLGCEPGLPTQVDVDEVLGIVAYDMPPFSSLSFPSFRNMLEGWHNGPKLNNQVHMYIGGTMATINATFDPIFFLHRCNIDRIWAQWQNRYLNAFPPKDAIVDSNGNKLPGQNIDDLLPSLV